MDEILQKWREEQCRIASLAIIPVDPPINDEDLIFESKRHSVLTSDHFNDDDLHTKLFGGVDVSFSERACDPSVAVYVIMKGSEIVYADSETFQLEIPYVSSYLSFREIEPLERLVKKQMLERRDLTPEAILVDGNGKLHVRCAGLATFLGVRTGLKTIGIGKTLYCHDGLTHKLVESGLKTRVNEFIEHCKNKLSPETNVTCPDMELLLNKRGLVMALDAVGADKGSTEENFQNHQSSGMSFQDAIRFLSPYCHGFSVQLKGLSGTIWGAALVGHGGKLASKKEVKHESNRATVIGTKNPIYISVGNNISLQAAVNICSQLSWARIPEPVRRADLLGREIMRKR